MANNASLSGLSIDLSELSLDTSPQLGGNLDLNSNNINGTGNVNINGSVTGQLFSGSGASLTNLNASNLASGTIPDARFPSALPAVDGSNLTGINTDLVSDTTPQLGGNLDTNGNDIEVGASDRITLGGIASGSYPEFQIKSTGSINQLLAYDGQIDFGRPSGGPFKLKLSQPSGAGGTSIELDSNTTGGHQRINAAQTAVPFELQYGGSTKLNIGSSAVAVTGNLTTTGTITPGTYRAGEVIECLTGTCDGRTIVGQSGSYTWPTAAQQIPSTSYVDMSGSVFSYTPPTGTNHVKYEFNFQVSYYSTAAPLYHLRFYYDGTEVTHGKLSQYAYYDDRKNYVIALSLNNGSPSIAAGKIGTWNTAKTIKLKVRAYSTSYRPDIHSTNYFDGGGSRQFVKPTLTITAIA